MFAPLLWIFVSFSVGICAGGFLQIPVPVLVAAGICAGASVLFSKNWQISLLAQCLFLLLIGHYARTAAECRYENPLRRWVRVHEQETVAIRGTVSRTPEIGDDFFVLRLQVSAVSAEPLSGIVRLTVSDLPKVFPVVGDQLETFARLRLPVRFRAEGTFNYEGYLKKEGIHALGSVKNSSLMRIVNQEQSLRSVISKLRLRLIVQTTTNFDARDAGILRALWLDDRSGLSGDNERLLINAGVFHVIAISGFHVAVLLLLSFFILKHLLSFRTALLILSVSLLFYFLLLEGRSSITRSFLTFLILAFSSLFNERIEWRNTLALSALAQVLLNPFELFDSGFHLTYLSTAAILFIAVPLASSIHLPRRIYQYLFNFLLVSLTVQVVLIPYQAFTFHKVPFASILANFVAIPLSSILIAAGTILMPVSILQPHMNYLIRHILSTFLGASTIFSEMGPYVVPSVPESLTILFYLLLLIGIFTRRKHLRLGCISLCAFWLLWILIPGPVKPKDHLRIHFIDVGQGDAILLEYPDGTFDLLDGGGFWNPEAFDIGEAVLLPYLASQGVRKLHRVFLSHAHADHMNGLITLLRYIPTRQFYVTRQPLAEPGFQMLVRSYPRKLIPVHQGFRYTQGKVFMEVLAPEDSRKTLSVANDDSLVLLVQYQNRRVLLMGDAEANTEGKLTLSGKIVADYIKVPHHGSKTSSNVQFLNQVRPKMAFLSAGKGNWFGHPHPEVVRRYRSRHVMLYRTDLVGTIRLTLHENGDQRIETFQGQEQGLHLQQ